MHTQKITPKSPVLAPIKCVIVLPLFPKDILHSAVKIQVGYLSTGSFLLKQMFTLLALSFIFTILIGYVIIYIFRRMLSQEKLHSIKNDFINNMTHELKTPIATISLAVDALNNPQVRTDEEKLNSYTRILKEENKKLNDHVEHVLQMALLEKGELMLDKKQIDVSQLVRNALESFQLQIKKQNAQINLDLDIATVWADEFHLLNAFNNIIDNALKYSKENCTISISVKKQNGQVLISFKDNGQGIDTLQQQKVFDKFYRVQGGDLHDVKGFGLGLSYVRSIIESHGGTIELKSEKNNGSEFIIKLNSHA